MEIINNEKKALKEKLGKSEEEDKSIKKKINKLDEKENKYQEECCKLAKQLKDKGNLEVLC